MLQRHTTRLTHEVCNNVYRLIAEQKQVDIDLEVVNMEVSDVAGTISEFMAVMHHHAEKRMFIMSEAEYDNLIDLLDYNVKKPPPPQAAAQDDYDLLGGLEE